MSSVFYRSDDSLFSSQDVERATTQLVPYIQVLKKLTSQKKYSTPESFLLLPSDSEMVHHIHALVARKVSSQCAGILVIGIGGASAGAKALSQMIPLERPMFFAESADPDVVHELIAVLKETYAAGSFFLTFVVSKSGSTIETLANYSVIRDTLQAVDSHWKEHCIFITESGSPLSLHAQKEGCGIVTLASQIGGRWSLFSPVALLPIAAAGGDIDSCVQGAQEATEEFLKEDQNSVALAGAHLYLHALQGGRVSVLFPFSERLAAMGDWWRQLVSESLGKDTKGLLPIVARGSADLHSLGQVLLDGPEKVFTLFMDVEEFSNTFPAQPDITGLSATVSLGAIMNATLSSIQQEYRSGTIPYATIRLKSLDPATLGAVFTFHMLSVLCAAYLLKVNPFDQPGVELYKKTLSDLLKK